VQKKSLLPSSSSLFSLPTSSPYQPLLHTPTSPYLFSLPTSSPYQPLLLLSTSSPASYLFSLPSNFSALSPKLQNFTFIEEKGKSRKEGEARRYIPVKL
jgi:hypothetical protein